MVIFKKILPAHSKSWLRFGVAWYLDRGDADGMTPNIKMSAETQLSTQWANIFINGQLMIFTLIKVLVLHVLGFRALIIIKKKAREQMMVPEHFLT